MYEIERAVKEIVGDNILFSGVGTLNIVLITVLGIILAIVWAKVYISQYVKIIIGCLAGLLAFAYLHFNYEQTSNDVVSIFIIGTIFLSIAEILIAPILHSVATKYSNPKYLAIIASLIFIPTRLLDRYFFNNPLIDESYEETFEVGMIAFFGLSIFVFFFIIFEKRHLSKS